MDWHWAFEQGGQHLLLLLSIIAAGFGVRTYLRKEGERRRALMLEQERQTALLRRIDRELHPENGDRGGPTAVDRIHSGLRQQNEHITRMDIENRRAHEEIHRRIDGIFEALGINGLQKRADRHREAREEEG